MAAPPVSLCGSAGAHVLLRDSNTIGGLGSGEDDGEVILVADWWGARSHGAQDLQARFDVVDACGDTHWKFQARSLSERDDWALSLQAAIEESNVRCGMAHATRDAQCRSALAALVAGNRATGSQVQSRALSTAPVANEGRLARSPRTVEKAPPEALTDRSSSVMAAEEAFLTRQLEEFYCRFAPQKINMARQIARAWRSRPISRLNRELQRLYVARRLRPRCG